MNKAVTLAEARRIAQLRKDGMPLSTIGREVGRDQGTVARVVYGSEWGHVRYQVGLPTRKPKWFAPTPAAVRERIGELYARGCRVGLIVKQLNVSYEVVRKTLGSRYTLERPRLQRDTILAFLRRIASGQRPQQAAAGLPSTTRHLVQKAIYHPRWARERILVFGSPKINLARKVDANVLLRMREMRAMNATTAEIASRFGISRNTVLAYAPFGRPRATATQRRAVVCLAAEGKGPGQIAQELGWTREKTSRFMRWHGVQNRAPSRAA